ncbi:hypothetical protein ACLOJK_034397 [Asimina triloba]
MDALRLLVLLVRMDLEEEEVGCGRSPLMKKMGERCCCRCCSLVTWQIGYAATVTGEEAPTAAVVVTITGDGGYRLQF